MRLRVLQESRAFQIPGEVQAQFERISVVLSAEHPEERLFLKINGKEEVIDVIFDPEQSSQNKATTHRNPETGRHEIRIGSVDDRDDIYGSLVHEYVHNIDPSIGYHGKIGDGEDYWTHPEEFNALSNQIIHTIIRRLAQLRQLGPDHAEIFLTHVHSALRYPMQYANWEYLPGQHIVHWWEDHPDLWKRFKSRLYNAVQDELSIDRDKGERYTTQLDFLADMVDDEWGDQ